MTKDETIYEASKWWRYQFSLIREKMVPYHETHLGTVPNPLPRPNDSELENFQQRIYKLIYTELLKDDAKAFDNSVGWTKGFVLYVDGPSDYDTIDAIWKDINVGVKYFTHGPEQAGIKVICVSDKWYLKTKLGKGKEWEDYVTL